MRWLDDHDVEYEKIDVIGDETAFDEMIRLSGQELAPVIEVDGEVLADFGPDQLADFWTKLEKRHARSEAR
jgi:glutaredoxin 3